MRTTISMLAATLLMASTANADAARWQVQMTVDPIDDHVSIAAAVPGGDQAGLFVGCTRGVMYVGVQTSPFDMQLGDFRQVTWRIDSEDAQRDRWENNDRGGAAIYEDAAAGLARRIRDAEARVVFASGRDTVQFSVRGSTQAIGRVLEHCGLD